MEMQGSVDIDCEAVDGGDTFPDTCVVDLGRGKVLASSDAVDEGQSAIDEGCGAVDGDRDSDNGEERVEEWGIALPNERGDETERPRLRSGLGLETFGDVGADNDTDDRAGVLSGVVTSPLVVSPSMEVSCTGCKWARGTSATSLPSSATFICPVTCSSDPTTFVLSSNLPSALVSPAQTEVELHEL